MARACDAPVERCKVFFGFAKCWFFSSELTTKSCDLSPEGYKVFLSVGLSILQWIVERSFSFLMI
jgi:hypothetical protein